MRAEIKNHFKKHDPVLYEVLQKVEDFDVTPSETYFLNLCDAIISQQLSEKVGTVIFNRFKDLFGGAEITPAAVLALPDEMIRTIGVSYSKIKYMKDLAQKILDKTIKLEELPDLTNEEVIQTLTQVKGIGPWTAEMFLMSSLGREDIFSLGDLGLKRGIQKLYNFSEDPTKDEMTKISDVWKPYRTYACRILWKSLAL